MDHRAIPGSRHSVRIMLVGLMLAALVAAVVLMSLPRGSSVHSSASIPTRKLAYHPRVPLDKNSFSLIIARIPRWARDASLEEISGIWRRLGYRDIEELDGYLGDCKLPHLQKVTFLMAKAMLLNFIGDPNRAYEVFKLARSSAEESNDTAQEFLYTVIYFQGVSALRIGETDNCVMCRGECSCILPIAPAAVHTNPTGSRLAIGHFTEYLEQFPDDLEVHWLLNLAHMTLGEYPQKVDHRYLISLDHFYNSELDIGKFRDIGQQAGINRFNQAGGAIMEDFDNDGLLDIAVTCFDATQPMAIYRNKGDGTFDDRSEAAGVTAQLGGLVCYQVDYNNDGWMDIYIPRGAWLPWPIRPTLLKNKGAGAFSDVTRESGLVEPVNSNAAAWADYDNDGWLDLFVGCEKQNNRLYHNKGNGMFEEAAIKAGVQGNADLFCKGCAWIDYDNDGYPDLFLNHLQGTGQLYHNNRDGTFSDVTRSMGIDGPRHGISCWAWDYDNDGWLDIFATSYDRTLKDVVNGLLGKPHGRESNRLFRNLEGKGFANVTDVVGLNMVFATMGSNYADFDNDGWLDMYLGTGDPQLETLVPNRMFKNVGGRRFAEITASSGTGHLQKGHGVSCGDWDRDGDVDLFVETGGVINSDRYHNILFQNPGQGNHWLTVKLVGKKTNRAAVGARIKVLTAGERPQTVYRHVSSGSSFGANPFQQTIGLAKADRVDILEVHWPTSGTTQVFRDIAADQAIEVTELAVTYRALDWKPVPATK
jgi:hypothetical protein